MKTIKRLGLVLLLLFMPVTITIGALSLSRQTMDEGIEALLPEVVSGTLYKSEIQHFNNGRDACVVCCVPESSKKKKKSYDIRILTTGGLFGNTIIMNNVDSYLLGEIQYIDGDNISAKADTVLQKKNSPYAAVYYGLAPLNVSRIKIGEKEATMVRQKITVDNVNYFVNLYYCFVPIDDKLLAEYVANNEISSPKVSVK